MPSWVGDAAMAMPMLKAVRSLYPQAKIIAYCKPLVREIVRDCPWMDQLITVEKKKKQTHHTTLIDLLKAQACDMALLLQNNFRTAWAAKRAGIPLRVGYARQYRGWLLTDPIKPPKEGRRFKKVSTLTYYLDLARYLADAPYQQFDPQMQLHTHPADDLAVEKIVTDTGVLKNQKLVLLTPGANYGMAKMWEPQKFAAVADLINQQYGAAVGVTGSPAEEKVLQDLIDAAQSHVINFSKQGINLKLLKSMVKRCDIVIANDTGPRHLAVAMGKPVVTIFGPTDPKWTTLNWHLERQVRLGLACSPCQAKVCPLAKDPAKVMACMKGISPQMVFKQVQTLWEQGGLSNDSQ